MLKPYWRTIEQMESDYAEIISRFRKLALVLQSFPEDVDSTVYYNDECGKLYIRLIIYLDKKITKVQMRKVIKWLTSLNGKAERFLRENEGKFAWRAEIEIDDWRGAVFVENAYHECELVKKTKTVEYYEADCSKERG